MEGFFNIHGGGILNGSFTGLSMKALIHLA